ncbi:MAG: hypothetical protein JO166_03925 [Deltaproteobacteria bacterium]|nr:hypothetical protein [Deltaproteobacteria bacterium]
MRIAKAVAVLPLPVVIAFAVITSTPRVRLWAQLPPSNPNLGPAVIPTAPPQLSQPAATTGIPPLATIPTPAAPTPSPSARAFNCSCFGPGSGTHWMGRVSASGYFAARQSATTACLSSNELKQVPSPFIGPGQVGGAAVAQSGGTLLPGTTQPANAAASRVLPGELNFSTATQLQMCSQCTCN